MINGISLSNITSSVARQLDNASSKAHKLQNILNSEPRPAKSMFGKAASLMKGSAKALNALPVSADMQPGKAKTVKFLKTSAQALSQADQLYRKFKASKQDATPSAAPASPSPSTSAQPKPSSAIGSEMSSSSLGSSVAGSNDDRPDIDHASSPASSMDAPLDTPIDRPTHIGTSPEPSADPASAPLENPDIVTTTTGADASTSGMSVDSNDSSSVDTLQNSGSISATNDSQNYSDPLVNAFKTAMESAKTTMSTLPMELGKNASAEDKANIEQLITAILDELNTIYSDLISASSQIDSDEPTLSVTDVLKRLSSLVEGPGNQLKDALNRTL